MKMPDNDNDANFWAIMERIVAGKLDEHDQTKRYDKLIEKVGENSAGLDNSISIKSKIRWGDVFFLLF